MLLRYYLMLVAGCCCWVAAPLLRGDEGVVSVGAGRCATALPAGAKEPPAEIFRTEAVRGPMPTNDWWSSLAWERYSSRHYAHPLAMQAGPGGLDVFYPGPTIAVREKVIFGFMPERQGDVRLGHAAQTEFPDARVDGFSDWLVSVRFAAGPQLLRVTYGHGSPFVYATIAGGDPQLTFPRPPEVWSGSERDAILGITINSKHYGLFGPTGSTWSGWGTKVLVNQTGGKPYFALAVLPDRSPATLARFRKYAYAHVVDTQVTWQFDAASSTMTTMYRATTKAWEGQEGGTLWALYPHQWRHLSDGRLRDAHYASVRGPMKLLEGSAFTTRLRFPGLLPALPNVGRYDRSVLAASLAREIEPSGSDRQGKAARGPGLESQATRAAPPPKDTYWAGKELGKLATLIPIAEQIAPAVADELQRRVQQRLETWFTAGGDPAAPARPLFYYHRPWGTLIGYPASYGSDVELNDHHFHYGYFIKAAAEIARRDPAWAGVRDERAGPRAAPAGHGWGGMVQLLIRDIASPDRADPWFPFLRCFDPYAGHSWASGHARFGDGNNQESSSEAMNAWAGIILWGAATGDQALRDLGIYLYATEMTAIHEYWFDVHGDNRPPGYTRSVVAMVWGGKSEWATWFSANPECVHGINWLPLHGGSLYLGHFPAYVRQDYAALARENGGTNWDEWADIILMYQALADPAAALAQFQATAASYRGEGGNSHANTFYWLHNLQELGHVEAAVTADHPLSAVFRKGDQRTYVAYLLTDEPRTVRFSDGYQLEARGRGFSVGRAGRGARGQQ